MDRPWDRWPYLTQELAGTGGRIRVRPEDFFVEEVPLYPLSGKGTHLFILVEKRGISTPEAVSRLARSLNRKTHEIGFAGMKDADAVTRQYLSVEHIAPGQVMDLDLKNMTVLDAAFHGNKLKLGHLKGNRFRIIIRTDERKGKERAEAILAAIAEKGLPNFFGPQRFGNFGNTHLLGVALLKRDYRGFVDILLGTPRTGDDGSFGKVVHHYREGDYPAALAALGRTSRYERRVLEILVRQKGRFHKAVAGIDKRMLQFYLSAFQSHLFNRYLERRLDRIDRLEEGDIAFVHRNGASFLVEDPVPEAHRLVTFEISPSGPLFGSKMLRARNAPGRIEAELLKEWDLKLEEIRGLFGIRMRGARRPLRVPLSEWSVTELEGGVEISFFLPPGSYATVLLREVTKPVDASLR